MYYDAYYTIFLYAYACMCIHMYIYIYLMMLIILCVCISYAGVCGRRLVQSGQVYFVQANKSENDR